MYCLLRCYLLQPQPVRGKINAKRCTRHARSYHEVCARYLVLVRGIRRCSALLILQVSTSTISLLDAAHTIESSPPFSSQRCRSSSTPVRLFRVIIVNRTYGADKNLYVSLDSPTLFGPTYYGPPRNSLTSLGALGVLDSMAMSLTAIVLDGETIRKKGMLGFDVSILLQMLPPCCTDFTFSGDTAGGRGSADLRREK